MMCFIYFEDNSRFRQLILPEGLLTFQTEGLRTISSNMLDIVRVDSEEDLDETQGLAGIYFIIFIMIHGYTGIVESYFTYFCSVWDCMHWF